MTNPTYRKFSDIPTHYVDISKAVLSDDGVDPSLYDQARQQIDTALDLFDKFVTAMSYRDYREDVLKIIYGGLPVDLLEDLVYASTIRFIQSGAPLPGDKS